MKQEQQATEERMQRQHEWQMREVRDETASELKHMQRQMDAAREDQEAQLARTVRDTELRLMQATDTAELEREEIRVEYE